MAKKESTFLNMLLTLVVIALVASLALGGIYNLTKEPIRLAKKAKEEAAIKAVIPAFDSLISFKFLPIIPENGKYNFKKMPKTNPDSVKFYIGYLNDSVTGVAISSFSVQGYDPAKIQVMVGFLPDGTISGTEVLQQKETPGLGTKMKDTAFRNQFRGKKPQSYILDVAKDGGNVDAITAATITSRAFCDAVKRACIAFDEKEGESK